MDENVAGAAILDQMIPPDELVTTAAPTNGWRDRMLPSDMVPAQTPTEGSLDWKSPADGRMDRMLPNDVVPAMAPTNGMMEDGTTGGGMDGDGPPTKMNGPDVPGAIKGEKEVDGGGSTRWM